MATFAVATVTKTLLHWSTEHFHIFGFDPDGGVPSFDAAVERIHPEDRGKALDSFERTVREGTDYEGEYRLVLPDGAMKFIHVMAHPVFSATGEVETYAGTVVDVTERRRADEAREKLRQARADLAHVSRVTTMGELTASLAHEVNQPIAAAVTDARTCLRWLQRDRPNVDEACAAASRVVRDATRAADIISRIRVLFTKGTAQPELVDCNEVVREMIALLRGEITRHGISVRTDLAADLPHVLGDRVQVQQVMMNLIMNSIDAMKDADWTREIVIRSRSTGAALMISVSDTGVGLPPQHADEIFDAFFTTKVDGTGMGLPISRSIVESLGGRLWTADESPRGASFHLTLPAAGHTDA